MNIRYENYGGTNPLELSGAESFMLCNNNGGYVFLGRAPSSSYQGAFFFSDDMYKAVEWIGSREECTKLILRKHLVEKEYSGFTERFFVPHGMNGFLFETTKGDFDFVLDCRKSYDTRDFGRYYQVEHIDDMIVISYAKKDGGDTYSVYVALHGYGLGYQKKGEWIKHSYAYDSSRGSASSRYVYFVGTMHCTSASVGYGLTREDAISNAKRILKEKDKLIALQEKEVMSKHISGVLEKKEVRVAYECCQQALEGLRHEGRIFAGFPWFFQYWSRDELITLGGLLEEHTAVLKTYFDSIGPDGRVANRVPHAELASADAIGWLFLRAGDALSGKMTKKDRKYLLDRMHHSLALLEKFHTQDYLASNGDLETWMDTNWEGDVRSGYRIEIQALRLRMYRIMAEHYDPSFLRKESQLKRAVRKAFWNGKVLADGAGDFTVRPNLFLAAYIYPKLLTKNEWKICFKNALRKLWLKWGGLATIDKKHTLFCDTHTGEKNQSYHRGDSWYFVNNLAAIAIARICKEDFARYVYKILNASTTEILCSGAAGCAAEISSAKELSSFGCWNQAWSNSTYIELVEELRKLKII